MSHRSLDFALFLLARKHTARVMASSSAAHATYTRLYGAALRLDDDDDAADADTGAPAGGASASAAAVSPPQGDAAPAAGAAATAAAGGGGAQSPVGLKRAGSRARSMTVLRMLEDLERGNGPPRGAAAPRTGRGGADGPATPGLRPIPETTPLPAGGGGAAAAGAATVLQAPAMRVLEYLRYFAPASIASGRAGFRASECWYAALVEPPPAGAAAAAAAAVPRRGGGGAGGEGGGSPGDEQPRGRAPPRRRYSVSEDGVGVGAAVGGGISGGAASTASAASGRFALVDVDHMNAKLGTHAASALLQLAAALQAAQAHMSPPAQAAAPSSLAVAPAAPAAPPGEPTTLRLTMSSARVTLYVDRPTGAAAGSGGGVSSKPVLTMVVLQVAAMRGPAGPPPPAAGAAGEEEAGDGGGGSAAAGSMRLALSIAHVGLRDMQAAAEHADVLARAAPSNAGGGAAAVGSHTAGRIDLASPFGRDVSGCELQALVLEPPPPAPGRAPGARLTLIHMRNPRLLFLRRFANNAGHLAGALAAEGAAYAAACPPALPAPAPDSGAAGPASVLLLDAANLQLVLPASGACKPGPGGSRVAVQGEALTANMQQLQLVLPPGLGASLSAEQAAECRRALDAHLSSLQGWALDAGAVRRLLERSLATARGHRESAAAPRAASAAAESAGAEAAASGTGGGEAAAPAAAASAAVRSTATPAQTPPAPAIMTAPASRKAAAHPPSPSRPWADEQTAAAAAAALAGPCRRAPPATRRLARPTAASPS
jgi:hypothetical protein